MRLKPAVSVDEAVNWLATQASGAWGVEIFRHGDELPLVRLESRSGWRSW